MKPPMPTARSRHSDRPLPGWRVCTRAIAALALALFLATEPGIGQDGSAGTDAAPQGPTAVAASAKIDNLAIITIEGGITAVTSKSFERRFDAALAGGADGVVVEIDSPGGEVGAVLEITSVIKKASVPVIAWINDQAYSGGAIIAIACDEIVLASGATMGDAAPVMIAGPMGLQNLSDTERAKILSPLIAEVVDSAARNGYDEVLVTAMVMLGVETWLVENTKTGQRHFLTQREYRALFNEDPPTATPIVQSGGVAPGAISPPSPTTPQPGTPFFSPPSAPGQSPAPDQGHNPAQAAGQAVPPQQPTPTRLPDNAPPAMRALADVADESTVAAASMGISAPSSRPDFATEDPADYRYIQYATDGNTLLTLQETGLRALGFTRHPGTINSVQELEQYVAARNSVRLKQSWSEDFVEFATQGVSGFFFRGAMIVIFLLGLFVEMAMPGVGVAGIVAMLALAGLIVPPLMIDASAWWTVVAILGGIGLIIVEIFVLPGLGVAGFLGLIALIAGLIGTFASAGELFPGTGTGSDGRLGWAIATVFVAVFGAGVGAYFVSKYTRSIPIARGLMLNATLATYDTSNKTTGMFDAMQTGPVLPVGVGETGVTTTTIRPEGEAEFDGKLLNVSTPSGWIERGTPVRVVEVSGNTIVVEPIEGKEATA